MNWLICIVILASCGCVAISNREESMVDFESDEPPEDCLTNPEEALDSYSVVEDFAYCAPYLLPDRVRIYFEGGAGRQWTLRENEISFRSLRILPKLLRDVSETDLSVTLLKQRISMPIGAAPVAYQKLASELGEIDTVREKYKAQQRIFDVIILQSENLKMDRESKWEREAVAEAGTMMIVSSISTTLLEDIAWASRGATLWMQTYIFPNRSLTVNLIRRAEAAGYKAIVVTLDSPILGSVPINAREILEGNNRNLSAVNVEPIGTGLDASVTFQDLAWLTRSTRLPVVAKGILTPEDAVLSVKCGVSAIIVSNHGGRQLDFVPASIDALPKIAAVIQRRHPQVEIYMDGGVRNGFDVFKALALGARAVFIGRPVIWGLAAGEQDGVRKVFDILRTELNQTMMLAGTPDVRSISKEMILEQKGREFFTDDKKSASY